MKTESGFFYHEQIRRYLLQFMRVFSHICIRTPSDQNGVSVEKRVPIVAGDMSKMVAQILTGQSENTAMAAPLMSAYISAFELAPNRRHDPSLVRKSHATELEFDPVAGEYTQNAGNKYSIEAYMPVPYDVSFSLDVWTTNQTSKLQILEQILVLFNPMIQLQQSQNPFDWTSLFELELMSTTWTNRTIGNAGGENDFATLKFKAGVWLSPPAKVTRQKLIHKIITNIYTNIDTSTVSIGDVSAEMFDDFDAQVVVSAVNNSILVKDGLVKLLSADAAFDNTLSWSKLIEPYGTISADTKIELVLGDEYTDDAERVYGTVALVDEQTLSISILTDSLPTNTLPSVNAIIDPVLQKPGADLPAPAIGQRYLFVSNTNNGEESSIIDEVVWGTALLSASENDIVEYTATGWEVVFDASESPVGVEHYLMNQFNSEQYKFVERNWTYSIVGYYMPGFWRLVDL